MLSKYQEKSFKDQNSLLPIIDNKLTHQRVMKPSGLLWHRTLFGTLMNKAAAIRRSTFNQKLISAVNLGGNLPLMRKDSYH